MIDDLLSRLEKVKPSGSKKWMACCPAHEDSTPSLAVKENADGTILLHCFAGCGASEILSAIDLTMADLFSDKTVSDIKDWRAFLKRHNYQKRREQAEENERLSYLTILTLAEGKRARGERLSRKELELEAEAFMRMKNENN